MGPVGPCSQGPHTKHKDDCTKMRGGREQVEKTANQRDFGVFSLFRGTDGRFTPQALSSLVHKRAVTCAFHALSLKHSKMVR